jgi:hypothetical protein
MPVVFVRSQKFIIRTIESVITQQEQNWLDRLRMDKLRINSYDFA